MDTRNRCSEPESILEEEEVKLCFGHKMALTWTKCSVTGYNFLTEEEAEQSCLVHRPEQGEHFIGKTCRGSW